jgi:PAS domain S-box-containing protein
MIHVLYVDDEPALLEQGKLFLERTGSMTVDTSESAQGALTLLSTISYDAVVSDFQMPEMDGIALLKHIRTGWGDLPFILFTGKGREEVVIEALNNGADFYLQKGSDTRPQFAELHHKIVQAVRRREADEKFRILVEESLVGVYILQKDRFLYVNPRFAEMFGYSQPEIMSSVRVLDLVSPDDRDMLEATLRSRFSGKIKSLQYSFSGRCKDGREIDVIVAGTSTTYQGQPTIIGTIHPAGGYNEADRNLILECRKITLLDMLTRHDITNQLTVLRGRLRQLKKQCHDPAILQQLKTVDDAGEVIYHLLETARVCQDIGLSRPRWQHVRGIIENMCVHLGISSLHVSLDVGDLEICADPLIDRVFANLLDNTIRHGIHATEVRVSFRKDDNGGTLVFEDNGVGVPHDLKERVFERGFGSNTGLGLFLCRQILSGTGIFLRETGIPGTGARFELTVPDHAWKCSGLPQILGGNHRKERSNTSS